MDWLRDTGERIAIASGHEVEVWSLEPDGDPAILSAWATHFRQQYIDDAKLLAMVAGTGKTNSEYVRGIIFPDGKTAPGPSTRSGDFAEILVADFLEFQRGYWCPRDRYKGRFNRNDSTKGADIIGFKFVTDGATNPNDELFVVEAKSGLTAGAAANRLQDAITDSIKDAMRESMTLNALKQRMVDRDDMDSAIRVQRFQNESDRPFIRLNGAAAVLDNDVFDATDLLAVDGAAHGNRTGLRLIVIRGAAMMKLVHALYEQAADEA
jgi:hypothetical protein